MTLDNIPNIEIPVEVEPKPVKLRWWQRFLRCQHLGICLIVLATLGMHFSFILTPNEPVFDEMYYIKDARLVTHGLGSERGEHPPLGKLLVVAGTLLFGDGPSGWRFVSVIFGTLTIVLFYFICRRLEMTETGTLAATFLLALENMTFVQASMAMLDVYFLTLTLATFLLYLWQKYTLSGVSGGLAVLTKLNGALAIPTIYFHWLFFRRSKPIRFLIGLVLAPVSFLALFPVFNYFIFGKWMNPLPQLESMYQGSASLSFATVTHEARRYPWDWILHHQTVAYYFNPDYSGTLSYTIWALIIPAVVYMVYRAIRGSDAARFGLSWFAGTYLLWIPIVFITDRVTYTYYFYQSIGVICLGLGLVISDLLGLARTTRHRKLSIAITVLVILYLLGHFGVFVYLSPVFSRWF